MNGKIGIATNNKGYVKIIPLNGEDLSSLPIMDVDKYRKIVKSIVEYMLLNRRKNGQLGKLIEIKQLNPEGYSLKKVEKIIDVSKLIKETSKYILGLENFEDANQFQACFNKTLQYLENFEFKEAEIFTKIPLDYCSDKIWKNLGNKLSPTYKSLFQKTKELNNQVSNLRRLENIL